MIGFLQTLPNVAILPTVLAAVVSLMVGAPYFGRYVLRLTPSDARDSAAFDAFKVVMATAGVMLAFSLVQAMTSLRASQAMVGREATAFAAVDRSLLRFATPQSVAIRPLLASYGQARIDLEWPLLARGERDETTNDRYNALSRTSRSLDPSDGRQQALFNELLKGLDDLSEIREATIQNSDLDLPGFFWVVAFGQLLVAASLATLTARTLHRLVTLGATAAAASLLLTLLIVVDHPFGGDLAVQPAQITKMLAVNARRV